MGRKPPVKADEPTNRKTIYSKVDGTGELAPHSAAQCSVPEINGPVVQQEFTLLLRETCNPSLSATTGLAASNGAQAGAGVSRGHSTGSNEPATKIFQ